MKTVDVNFKKVDVVDYYSQLDQVKIRILYDDGEEQAYVEQFSINDSEAQSRKILTDIRDSLKSKHRYEDSDDHPLSGHLVLRYKQEEDIIQDKMFRFLNQVSERIRSGKLANLSYFDMSKKITGFSANF